MNSLEKAVQGEMLGGFKSDNAKRSDSQMVKSTCAVFSRLLKELSQGYKELYGELKELAKRNIYKVLRAVIIGVIAFALCIGLAFGVLYVMGTYNKYVFTTDNWNTYRSDRINMIDNMESKFDIVGMNQVEVEKLLGKPKYEISKENCEYIALADKKYDKVVEYELNTNSRSITDVIEKYYVIAYDNDEAIYAEVLMADKMKR